MSQPKSFAIEPTAILESNRTGYPVPYAEAVQGRYYCRLTEAVGLSQFGVNICRLEPGAMSSQRHWHEEEDEFIYILEGTPTLITEGLEEVLQPGMVAGFPAGQANGHHLINRSSAPVRFLVVGARTLTDRAHYPDIDLAFRREKDGTQAFYRKNGEKY